MAVKAVSTNYLGLVINSSLASNFNGLGDIQMQWQKPIDLYKPLDFSAPLRVAGKLQGELRVSGIASSTAGLTQLSATLNNGVFTASVPTHAEITLSNGTADCTFSGYSQPAGMSFRKIADRVWVLDKNLTYLLID
jgi:hypothetical protein